MASCGRLIAVIALLLTQPLVNGAHAQDYPSRPIRIINGASPEIIPRMFGKIFTDTLGQSVIVESIPGAGGKLAAETAAKARPDGYTLLNATATMMIYAAQQKSGGDLARDYVPVAMTSYTPFVLTVSPTLPASSVQDLIALAKAKPGQLNYGANYGSFPHLAFELFKRMAKIDIVHIPYKRSEDVLPAILSGQTYASFMVYATVAGLSKSGKVRNLAVTTARRSKTVPDLPTLSESGLPGYDLLGWNGFVAPLGTPPAVVVKLNATVRQGLRQAEVTKQLAAIAQEPGSDLSPEQYAEFLKTEMAKWTKIVKETAFKTD